MERQPLGFCMTDSLLGARSARNARVLLCGMRVFLCVRRQVFHSVTQST